MGLFSKKECALCGGKAGLLTRTSLSDDNYICGDCRKKMSANIDNVGHLTLDDVREQIRLKEENDARYADEFVLSRRIEVDSSHPVLAVDDTHGWFAMLKDEKPDIFTFDQISSYNVDLHTEALSEEERKNSSGLFGVLNFLFSDDFSQRYPDMPRCPNGCKVIGMHFEIGFGPNPFLARQVRLDMIPGWSNDDTAVQKAYRCANEIWQCIREYKSGAHTPVREAGAPAGGNDALDQIKKLKDLLDMGAITQEEFATKKKQLLGL